MAAMMYLELPDDGFKLSRATLRSPTASADALAAACDVLDASHDWHDIFLVREIRLGLFAKTFSELQTNDARRAFEAQQRRGWLSEAEVGMKATRMVISFTTFMLGWITGTLMCAAVALGWW